MICYEKTCEVCYGQPKPCAACGNTGTVPTEAGKALLGFLERHGPLQEFHRQAAEQAASLEPRSAGLAPAKPVLGPSFRAGKPGPGP
jgi:hypothetical protein